MADAGFLSPSLPSLYLCGADVLSTFADAGPERHDQVVVCLVLWTGG